MTLERSERTPVIFTDRLGPNFLWHMLAVTKISYDSEYADRFAESVQAKHRETLAGYERLLRFGEGETSALTGFFTFLPGWLRLESTSGFERYFTAMDRCLTEGSLRVFVEEFREADWTDPWFHHFTTDPGFPPSPVLRRAAEDLAAAYTESFDRYRDEVWPIARREMAPRLAELMNVFALRDYVIDWEAALGLAFESPSYEIVLCHSNKGGPDCNSLGYCGNLFNYSKPFDRTWQLVSHEIGTHLLFGSVMDLIGEGRYEQSKLYFAYEVLAMFFNKRVLGRGTLAYDLARHDGPALLEFCEREWSGSMTPDDLLVRIADRFCTR
jgi:hypothetical protein